MGEDFRSAIGKDEGEFVGKPLAIMQNLGSVFFLFFPVIDEFDRAPVRDMTIFAFSEHSIQHSRCAQQSYMTTMQRRERTASGMSQFGQEKPASLPVCSRLQQEIFHFVQSDSRVC